MNVKEGPFGLFSFSSFEKMFVKSSFCVIIQEERSGRCESPTLIHFIGGVYEREN